MKEHVKILIDTRKAKGLDLSEVSRKTGIRQTVLESIESGELPELPVVYLRSFIKKYASFLGLSSESYSELLTELDNRLAKEQLLHRPLTNESASIIDPSDRNVISILKSQNYKELISDKRLVSSIMYLGLGLVLISIIYFVFFSSDSKPESSIVDNIEIGDEIKESQDEESLLNYFETSDSIVLEAFALDTSWMSVTIDGKKNEEILLKPGAKKVWKAAKFFTITAGNAGGVQLKRNGEKLEPLGARGNVVNNVKITKDEVSK
ncbi:MAG: helix-turn-helix domain-containing protein [Candidatus Kapaibacterium sp.]